MASENSDSQLSEDTLCFQKELDYHSEIANNNLAKTKSKIDLLLDHAKAEGAAWDCNEEVMETFKLIQQTLKNSDDTLNEIKEINQKEKEYLDEINMYKEKIRAMKEQLKTNETEVSEESISKSEARRLMEIYKQAISKYTKIFDFNVDIEDIQEDKFTAVIKFKGKANKPIRVVINQKLKSVKSIDATSIGKCVEISEDENENVRHEGVLYKLRELLI